MAEPAPSLADEFSCPICRELVYKPVFNACGHFFCFWCIHRAMDPLLDSRCPLCRTSFSHFSRVCEFLHSYLYKTFPNECAEREAEVSEEENSRQVYSPKITFTPQTTDLDMEHSVESESQSHVDPEFICPMCKKLMVHPCVLNCGHGFCSSCILGRVNEEKDTKEEKSSTVSQKNKLLEDFNAATKKEENHRKTVICFLCNFPHKDRFPSECLSLQNYFKKIYGELFTRRLKELDSLKEKVTSTSMVDSERLHASSSSGTHVASTSNHVSSDQISNASGSSESDNIPTKLKEIWNQVSYLSQRSEVASTETERAEYERMLEERKDDFNIHFGVGCDGCGAFPIVGRRFRCEDCPERIGFDLCGDCKSMKQSTIHGRFNQQHGPTHRFREITLSENIVYGIVKSTPNREYAFKLLWFYYQNFQAVDIEDDDDGDGDASDDLDFSDAVDDANAEDETDATV